MATGGSTFGEHKKYFWTMGWAPTYQSEGHVFADALQNHPNGKIAILYQDDDSGKDYIKGVKDAIAGRMPILGEMPYQVTDPTVDSQIISLRASGAEIFFNLSGAKQAAQAIQKGGRNWMATIADLGIRFSIGWLGAQARRNGKRQRAVDSRVPEGSHESNLEGRSWAETVGSLHATVPPGR